MHHFLGYNMNWSDYSYASNGSLMVVLIIILGALAAYLLLDKNTRTNKWSDKQDVWEGEDIQPDYNAGQVGVPFTPSLDEPFNDPEMPNRPSKKLKKPKKRKTTLARGVKPVKRKTKKRTIKRKTK